MPHHRANWLASKTTNLPFNLRRLSHEIQAQTLFRLSRELGYQHLRMSFEAYIALIEPEGSRQTDLAQLLNVSKQNCNQVIKSIETAGYLERKKNPLDGRGKLLFLTQKGQALVADGNISIQLFEKKIIDSVGKNTFLAASHSLLALCKYFSVPLTTTAQPTGFSSLLFRFNDFTTQALFESLASKGHTEIRPSYTQVLENISQQHMSIQQLASINNVTKQAIGAIAKHLQQLGYIRRHTNESDGRQALLGLSDKGKQLINDSATACEAFHKAMLQALGKTKLAQLESTLKTAYDNFETENAIPIGDSTMQLAAKKLINKMGAENAKLLAASVLRQLN